MEDMKDIEGYEGLYAITVDGQVWSYKSNRFLSLIDAKDGYLKVGLYKDGKQRTFQVHRLVGEAYIPNPENKPQINHLDENKRNNHVSNLAWATAKENSNYGTRNARCMESRKKTCSRSGYVSPIKKSVYCVELDQVFDSINKAAKELGLDDSHIVKCCKGKQKTHGGYHWQYV